MCHFELVYKSFQVTISSFPTGADFKQSQQNSACNRLFCQNTARVRGWIWREHTLRHKMARPPWDAGQPGSQQTITESKLPMLCCILTITSFSALCARPVLLLPYSPPAAEPPPAQVVRSTPASLLSAVKAKAS